MVTPRFLAATLATAAFSNAVTPSWRSSELAAVRPRGPDVVTHNVLELRQTDVSTNSKASRLRRRMMSADSRRLSKRAASPVSLTQMSFGGYSADVTIDGKTYPVVVEIITSDLWVAVENVQCLETTHLTKVKPEECAYGPNLFKGTPSGGMLSNQNFFIEYGDGEALWGTPGVAKVDIAGMSIDKQVIGLCNSTAWIGDNVTVGQLGLAYPITDSFYNGPYINETADNFANQNKSDLTLLQSLMKKDPTLKTFAIAQARAAPKALLAFGGIPDVPNDGKFATVPIRPMKYYVETDDLKEELAYYAILPDAYDYEGYKKFAANYTNSTLVQDDKFETVVMLDLGSPTMNMHTDMANAVAHLFDPPAYFDEADGDGFVAPCNAKVPKFAVKIGGQSFPVSKDNMLLADASFVNKTTQVKMCKIGVQDGGTHPPFTLGYNFMKNVVSVFDVGAGQMRFAAVPE